MDLFKKIYIRHLLFLTPAKNAANVISWLVVGQIGFLSFLSSAYSSQFPLFFVFFLFFFLFGFFWAFLCWFVWWSDWLLELPIVRPQQSIYPKSSLSSLLVFFFVAFFWGGFFSNSDSISWLLVRLASWASYRPPTAVNLSSLKSPCGFLKEQHFRMWLKYREGTQTCVKYMSFFASKHLARLNSCW